MSLRGVDLNLLPVLRELLRQRNVSRAAMELGMSQSATSAALARLRRSLGDEILVSIGRRMEMTARARELVPEVEEAIRTLERVWRQSTFDPATARRRFVVASVDYLAFLIGPALVRAMREAAPGCTIQFVDGDAGLIERMRLGEIDFAVLPWDALAILRLGEMRTAFLFRDRFVAVAGADHPLAQPGAVEDAHRDTAHIVFRLGIDTPLPESQVRRFAGYQVELPLTFRFQQFVLMPMTALESGCVALVPERLAERVQRYLPIVVLDSPIVRDSGFDLHAVWSPVHNADPAHRWMLELLRDVVRRECPEAAGPPPAPPAAVG